VHFKTSELLLDLGIERDDIAKTTLGGEWLRVVVTAHLRTHAGDRTAQITILPRKIVPACDWNS
jgi:hypothetical protein